VKERRVSQPRKKSNLDSVLIQNKTFIVADCLLQQAYKLIASSL